MDFTAYITLCLILVAPSCHSTREERPAKRAAWGKLPDDEQNKFKYLALFKCASNIMFSGTILSESMVMTSSDKVQSKCDVYAGKVSLPTTTKTKTMNGEKQVRQVETVKEYEGNDLKICVMNNPWKFNDNVGPVTLNKASELPAKKCTVLGFREDGANIVAYKLEEQDIASFNKCTSEGQGAADHLYSKAAAADQKLGDLDRGGPAVCDGDKQWGINVECKKVGPTAQQVDCNSYLSIAHYSTWIEEQKTAAESGAPGGTGGNSTSPSSGYSIHSYLNKYSNWKVLGFLVPTIVTFLQY